MTGLSVVRSRGAFAHFLRTGRRVASDIETKSNPNHDPTNGQFTSGPGGGASAGRASRQGGTASQGGTTSPFGRHAGEQAIDQEVASKLNRLLTDPSAKESITVAGTPLTFQRTGPNTAKVTGLDGQVSINGHFDVQTNKVTFSLGDPQLSGVARLAKIVSFPTSLTVYRAKSGRMVYSMNKPVSVRSWLGNIDQQAGSYLFKH